MRCVHDDCPLTCGAALPLTTSHHTRHDSIIRHPRSPARPHLSSELRSLQAERARHHRSKKEYAVDMRNERNERNERAEKEAGQLWSWPGESSGLGLAGAFFFLNLARPKAW